MKRKTKYRIIYLLLISLGCTHTAHKQKPNKEYSLEYNFIGKEGYAPDKKIDLRDEYIFLCFSAYFKDDVIRVKYNNIDSSFIITTDEITGHAYDVNLGEIKDSTLKMYINNCHPFTLSINSDNKLLFIEKEDSLVIVSSMYYLPAFY